jgi:hypothetical protein
MYKWYCNPITGLDRPLGPQVCYSIHLFENRVLRRIFMFKRDEVRGEWRKLHNE